ncbi:MAG: monovalent cation/H(+) antiporter subunit G [Candidatus Nanopelagicales bacterium]
MSGWAGLGAAAILVGASLVTLAGVGLLRLPDPLTRATAVSKAASLGVILVLLGTLAMAPSPRNAVLVALVLVAHIATVPLSGMALGRAAYRSGTARPPVTVIDEPRSRRERARGADPEPGR